MTAPMAHPGMFLVHDGRCLCRECILCAIWAAFCIQVGWSNSPFLPDCTPTSFTIEIIQLINEYTCNSPLTKFVNKANVCMWLNLRVLCNHRPLTLPTLRDHGTARGETTRTEKQRLLVGSCGSCFKTSPKPSSIATEFVRKPSATPFRNFGC